LAAAASQTTNPLVLALIGTVAVAVALARRGSAPWAQTLRLYVYLALTVVAIRVGFRVVFGAAGGGMGAIALNLPLWRLPGGALTLFGPVTWDGLYLGLRDGMRLACLILAVGAANVLASPKRVLAALPGALRQVGTAVVVALTVFPCLALSLRRVRRAVRLRGPAKTKRGAALRIVFPVLADALDRSLNLAASLESRGYGATARAVSPLQRAVRAVLAVLVTLLSAAGALGVTGGQAGLGWPALALAGGLGWALLRWLGRDVAATRLRRDPWGAQDWMIALCAAALVAGIALSGPLTSADALNPSALAWPPLPWPALLGLALAAFGALAASPQPPGPGSRRQLAGQAAGGGAG
jgi:energy-coupling factor transport system permease protein